LRASSLISGADPGRLAIALLLDERPIPGHIIDCPKHRLQWNLKVPSEFLRCPGIRAVDSLVDDRRADAPALEEYQSNAFNCGRQEGRNSRKHET
jgi:hypothetical protein